MSSRPKAPVGLFIGGPRCKRCDVPFASGIMSDGIGYCRNCQWEQGYEGPQRPSQCVSCFNNIGLDKKGHVQCAALMYQMRDGTWRDRTNQAERCHFIEMGMKKICQPIVPDTRKKPEFMCECYEDLKGKSRDHVRLMDPLSFYSRKRFW